MSLKNALLGLLTYGPMTGYDLKTIFDKSIHHFWDASTSQIYRDLTTLESEDYVSSRIEPQEGRPNKKIYTVTTTGKEAFQDWVNRFPAELNNPIRYDFLVRVFFGSQIDPVDLKFQFQKYIREQQEILNHLAGEGRDPDKLGLQNSDADQFFWGLTIQMGLTMTKAAISWAEECLKDIDENFPANLNAVPSK